MGLSFFKNKKKSFSHINFVIFSKKEDTTMIIVNKDEISSAVKQAKAMIKPSLLVLENSLRFTAKQSKLFIRTNSGGVRFTTMLPCKCDKGKIDFIISIGLISSTLPFFTSESVEIIPDSRKKVVLLKSTELQVELKTIPLSVWASYKPRTNWNIDVPIKADTLAYLVERTAYASDTKDSSDNRAMLNFSITEGILNVTGLDLYRFAICTSKDKINDFTKTSFTIPVKTLQAILPYLKDEEIVHLKKYTNEYAITSKKIAIYGHTPAADFYNIASHLAKCPSNSIRVDKEFFLRYCEVAAITNRTKISINIEESLMEISASGNGGKVENRMKIDGVVKSRFCVNPSFIMDVLKKCPDREIQMFYSKDGTEPLFFRGDDHIDMVLPIRC